MADNRRSISLALQVIGGITIIVNFVAPVLPALSLFDSNLIFPLSAVGVIILAIGTWLKRTRTSSTK